MNIWIKYLHRPYQAGVAKGKKYSCIVSERLRRHVLDTFLILRESGRSSATYDLWLKAES